MVFEIISKKLVSLISRGKKQISPLLSPGKTFGKIHFAPPPGKDPSNAHAGVIEAIAWRDFTVHGIQFLNILTFRLSALPAGVSRLVCEAQSLLACTYGHAAILRIEFCTGGKSVIAQLVKRLLPPTHQHRARGWTDRNFSCSSVRHYSTPGVSNLFCSRAT